jgi:hypothetical protein
MIPEITAAAVVAAVVAIGGWVWKLASRLATVESRAHTAEVLASGASVKVSTVEQDLSAHKEHVAAEYVSRDALKEITGAINRLDDRLDALFIRLMPRP